MMTKFNGDSSSSASRSSRRTVSRILVVDDDPDCRRLAWHALEVAGLNPIEAATGIGAVEKARDCMPDIILLDLHLPGMSGFEVLRILHAATQTRHIPVLCVTGEADPVGLLRDASLWMALY